MNAHSIIHGREENISAQFDQLPDAEALSLLPKLLHRFSGTWGFDRAIEAIDDIINEMDLDPDADILALQAVTVRCIEADFPEEARHVARTHALQEQRRA